MCKFSMNWYTVKKYISILISAKLALESYMRKWYCWFPLGKRTEWIFQKGEKELLYPLVILLIMNCGNIFPIQRWINDVESSVKYSLPYPSWSFKEVTDIENLT